MAETERREELPEEEVDTAPISKRGDGAATAEAPTAEHDVELGADRTYARDERNCRLGGCH